MSEFKKANEKIAADPVGAGGIGKSSVEASVEASKNAGKH